MARWVDEEIARLGSAGSESPQLQFEFPSPAGSQDWPPTWPNQPGDAQPDLATQPTPTRPAKHRPAKHRPAKHRPAKQWVADVLAAPQHKLLPAAVDRRPDTAARARSGDKATRPSRPSAPSNHPAPTPADRPIASPNSSPDDSPDDSPNNPPDDRPRPSVWADTIRPLVADNWLLLVGAFLVVASGAYLLSVVWGELSSFGRRGLSFGVLIGLGAGFSEIGRYLGQKQQLKRAYRALWAVGIGFVGLAAPVAGFMVGDQPVFGLAGVVVVVVAGLGLAGVRHPDGDGRWAPPAALATAGLLLVSSLAALGQHATTSLAVGWAYAGALALWLVMYLTSPTRAGERSKDAEKSRDSLVRIGRVFGRLGPPIYLFLVLIGVTGARLWMAGRIDDAWAWGGGLAGLVGLAVVEFGRRHLDEPRIWNVVAGALALVGMVVGLGDHLALVAASVVSAAVFWRIPADLRTRYIFGYASSLAAYSGLVQVAAGAVDHASIPTTSLAYLPFLVLLALRHWRLRAADTEASVNAWVAAAGAWTLVTWALADALGSIWAGSIWPLAVCGAVATAVELVYFVGRPSKWPGYSAVGIAVVWAMGIAGFGLSTPASLPAALLGAAAVGALLVAGAAAVERTAFVNTAPDSLPGRLGDVLTDMSVVIGMLLACASAAVIANAMVDAAQASAPNIPSAVTALAGCTGAYAALLLWQAHRSGSALLGYTAFGAFALFGSVGGYLLKKTYLPTSHGWGLAVAAVGVLAVYELYLRVDGNPRPPNRRARLFGRRIDQALPDFWTSLCRNYAHTVALALVVLVFVSRTPELVPRLVAAAVLVGVGSRAIWRRPRQPVSYWVFAGALQTMCWCWVDWHNPNHLVLAGLAGAFVWQGCMWLARRVQPGVCSQTSWPELLGWSDQDAYVDELAGRASPVWSLGFGAFVANSLVVTVLLVATALPLGWSNPVTLSETLPWALLALVAFGIDQFQQDPSQQKARYSAWAGAVFASLFGFLNAPQIFVHLLSSANDTLGGMPTAAGTAGSTPSLWTLSPWTSWLGGALSFLFGWLVVDIGLGRRADNIDADDNTGGGERLENYRQISGAAVGVFGAVGVVCVWASSLAHLPDMAGGQPIGLTAILVVAAIMLYVAVYAHTKTPRAYVATVLVLLICPVAIAMVVEIPSVAPVQGAYETALFWVATALAIAVIVDRTRHLSDPGDQPDGDDTDANGASIASTITSFLTRRDPEPWPTVLAEQIGLWRGSVRLFVLLSVYQAWLMAPANAAIVLAAAALSLVLVGKRPLRAYRDLLGVVAALVLTAASALVAVSDLVAPLPPYSGSLTAAAVPVAAALAALLLPWARSYLAVPDDTPNDSPDGVAATTQTDPIEAIRLGLMVVASLLVAASLVAASLVVRGPDDLGWTWVWQHACDLLTLGVLGYLWVRRALRTDRTWPGYVSLATICAGYAYLRFIVGVGNPGVDPWIWVGAASAAVAVREYLGQSADQTDRAHPLASPLTAASYLAPIAAIALAWVGRPVPGPVWATVAVFYLVVGMIRADQFTSLICPASVLAFGCLPTVGADHTLAVTEAAYLSALVVVGVGWMVQLWRTRLERFAFAGIASFLAAYLYIRLAVGVGSTHYDPWIINGFAALFLALDAIFDEKILKRAILAGGVLFPAAALAVAVVSPGVDTAYLWSVASLIYILVGWKLHKKGMYIPAIILLDVELFLKWFDLGVTSPMFFTVPAGLTCLGIARFYRQQLPDWGHRAFRLLGLAVIYLPSMAEVFEFESAWTVVAAAIASIAGIAAGIGFRVRSYLFAGATALVLTVGVNLFHIGLKDRFVGSVMLFVVGVSVLAAGVLYSAKTDRIRRRYDALKDELSDWR